MTRNKTRHCLTDGKEYTYCPHCGGEKTKEPWRMTFCSENCRDAFQITTDYLAGEIDAETAKAKFSALDMSNKKNFRNDIKAAIDEVNGFKKRVDKQD